MIDDDKNSGSYENETKPQSMFQETGKIEVAQNVSC